MAYCIMIDPFHISIELYCRSTAFSQSEHQFSKCYFKKRSSSITVLPLFLTFQEPKLTRSRFREVAQSIGAADPLMLVVCCTILR